MGIFSSLNRDQKEAIGILQVGTLLEFFDLMLYVHMGEVLNELFFPPTDPFTAKLISGITFCSIYICRPFGALIFGYIGDNFGRKPTVIFTTMIMALTCAIMASAPTYVQIGITASFIVTACRIVQGLCSMGEIIGAEIYLTEMIKPPARYAAVSCMVCGYGIGSFMALGVASIALSFGLGWRIAFCIGALIALIGTVARTALRETPDFINAKVKAQKIIKELGGDLKKIENNPMLNEKVDKKTSITHFFIQCGYPICFYFVYIYCGGVLKNEFNYNTTQIINNNLIVALVEFLGVALVTYLSYKIHPLKILKFRMTVFSIFILFLPHLLSTINSPFNVLLIQSFICLFILNSTPADAVLFIHFPIFKRFTYISFMYALSRAGAYVISTLGFIYLVEKFGNYGILVIFVPITINFIVGVLHFEKLEKMAGNYYLANSVAI
jgi:MFS transporter, MHS family, proline/betaine transporter